MAPPRPPHSTLRRLVVDEVDDVYFPEDLTGAVPFLVQDRQVTASDACSDARDKESSGTRTNADRKGTPERYVKCSSSQTVSAKAKALRRLSKFPSGGDTIVSRGGDDSASEGSATSRTHRTLGGKGPGEEHSSSHVRRKAPGVLAGAPCSHERGVGSVEDVLAGLTVAAADSCTTSTAGDRGVTPAPGVRGGTGTVDLEAVRCSADWRASRTHCQNNRSLLSVAAFPEGTGGVETTNSCAITEESGRLPISEALPPLLLSSERTSTGERGERVGGSTTEGSRIPVAGWWTDQSSERKRSRQLPPPPRSRVGHPPALQPSETRCARVSATSGRSECLSTQQVPSGCGRRSGGRDDNRSCQKVDDSSSGGDSHSERTGPSVSEVCLRVEARGSHGSPAGARSALSYNSVIEQNGLPEREVVVKSRSPALLLPAFKGSRPLEAASCLEGGKNSGGVLQLGREWTAQVRCLNEFVRSSKKSLSVLPLPPVQRDLRAEETASLTRTPTDHQRIGRSRPSRVWTADNHTTGAAEKGDTHVGVSGCPPSSHCSATPPRAPCAGRCAERSRSTENEKNPAPSVSPASCFTPTPNNLRSPFSLLLPPLPYPSVQRPACFLARPSRWALAETSFQLAGLGRCRSQQEKSTCSLPSDDTERRRSESRPEPPPPGNKQSHRSCSATSRTAAAGQRHSGSFQNCLPPAPRKLVPPSPATSRLKPSACADRLQQQEGTAGRSEKWRRETTQSFAAMQRGKAGGGSGSPERRGVGARDSSRSGNTGRSSLAAGLFDLNEGNTRRPLVSFVEPVAPPAGPRSRPSGPSGDLGTGRARLSLACTSQTATGWRAAVDSVMAEVEQMRDGSGTAVFRDIVRIQSVVGESVEVIPAASVESHRRGTGTRTQFGAASAGQQRRSRMSESVRRSSEWDDDVFSLSSFGRRGSSELFGGGTGGGAFRSSRRTGSELNENGDRDRVRSRRGRDSFFCTSNTSPLPSATRPGNTGPSESDAEDMVFQMWLQQEAILENTFPLHHFLTGEEALERAMLASFAAMGGENLDSFLAMLQQPLLLLHQHGRWRNASLAVGPPGGGWARLWGFDGPIRVAGGVGSSSERRAPLTEAEVARNTRRWVFKKPEPGQKDPPKTGGKSLSQKLSYGAADGTGYSRQGSTTSSRECGFSRASTRSSLCGDERKPAVQPGIAAQPPTPPAGRGSPAAFAASSGFQAEHAPRGKQSSTEKGGATLSGGDNKNCCSICLADYQSGDEIITFRCMHIFHFTCVHDWLQHSGRRTCPLCLVPIKASEDSRSPDVPVKKGECGGHEDCSSESCASKEE